MLSASRPEQEQTSKALQALEPGASPIPGYRLLEVLGRGAYGEVWKCEAPGGFFKAIKCIYGRLDGLEGQGAEAELELEALQRVKLLRHPFILSMDRVEIVDGQVYIVSELADQSLNDIAGRHKDQGLNGIPREELLAYLREAAEALDWMHQKHALQHLDVKPSNLLLVSNHIKVSDFGLVRDLSESPTSQPDSRPLGSTPLYAAPETFQGTFTAHSDQYSLAVVYQELATSQMPFKGRNARQMALLHTTMPPDLSPLSSRDQAIVARALAKKPHERFPSCLEFIEAPRCAPKAIAGNVAPPKDSGQISQEASTPCPYQFLDCLARTSLGEVWKVQTSDNRVRAARVLPRDKTTFSHQDHILAALFSPSHPALALWEIGFRDSDRLILVTDLWEQSLSQRFEECRAANAPGLPRVELLPYLHLAAEALDAWFEQYHLHHLTLSPRALQVLDQQLRIIDAGMAELIGTPIGETFFDLNTRYGAPELADNQLAPTSDQYSLAIIYHELLTGFLPQHGKSTRQLLAARRQGLMNLDLLPVAERAVVARALEPNPAHRFSSCQEFVHALSNINRPGDRQSLLVDKLPLVMKPAAYGIVEALNLPSLPSPQELAKELVTTAAGPWSVHQFGNLRYLMNPGEAITYRCGIRLVPEVILLKLRGFAKRWEGRILQQGPDFLDIEVSLQVPWWQKVFHKKPGFWIRVHVLLPLTMVWQLVAVEVTVKPVNLKTEESTALLERVGPILIQSIRDHLQPSPEQRIDERIQCNQPIRVFPVLPDYTLDKPIDCQTKDISGSGIGVIAPVHSTVDQFYIQPLAGPSSPETALLAYTVRMEQRSDGQFELGLKFLKKATTKPTNDK